ncbi:MAG: amidase [Deltaproteobacteria bacterium]|nr:amidase [Deltaproteobacteria bacterium]
MSELAFTPVHDLARLTRTRRISPRELVALFLERIAELNPTLNAYLTVNEEEATRAAADAEKAAMRTDRLPLLFGIPVAIKDLEFTKGLRSTGGSLAYRDYVPDEDSVVVERLRNAGAIILGKTNTPEFGSYGQTWNRLGEDCRTPWDPTRTSGGSSGGSAAAVAAGLAPFATGTDGAGSIRAPAAFCGVYGFKPSFGRIPLSGGFLGLPPHTCAGPLTRSVRDAALMLSVLCGHDPRDPNSTRQPPPNFVRALSRPAQDLRVAWSPNLGFAHVDAETQSLAETAARALETVGYRLEAEDPQVDVDLFKAADPVRNADKYAAWGHLLRECPDDLTSYVRSVLEHGSRVTGEEYSNSLRELERLNSRMADFFERYDLLVTPTTSVPAYPVRQPPPTINGFEVPHYASTTLLTILWNLTGQPAASLPCGFTEGRLPVGLQLIGRPGDDLTVLRASRAFEEARPWPTGMRAFSSPSRVS